MCIIYWGGFYFGKPHGTMYSCVDVGAVSADMRVPQGTLPGICHTHRAAACRPRNKIQSDPQNVAHYLEHPVFLDTVSWMATAVVVVLLLLLTIIILFFSFLFFPSSSSSSLFSSCSCSRRCLLFQSRLSDLRCIS